MTIAVGILSFFLGIALTLYIFGEEIYHGQKVGYGPNDIHLDSYGSCCRHVPPAQYKPPIVIKKQ